MHQEPEGQVMDCQARIGDHSRTRHRTDSDSGRVGDWGNAVVVALVLSIAVFVAAIVIALYDNSVMVASRYTTATPELSKTAQGVGPVETDGRAR
jgi:hypothetical protein